MPGLVPRLSGSRWTPLKLQLSWVAKRRGLGFEKAVELPAVHQVGAHQAGEGERARDSVLRRLRDAQQQEGDQRDRDLDLHRVFAGTEKAADLERLLDPAEEQLDRPTALVEI